MLSQKRRNRRTSLRNRDLLTFRSCFVMVNAMTRIAVLDTETTGLFTKEHDLHVSQPWPVQIAAVIVNGQFEIVERMNLLAIPPEGAIFSEKASLMHGYTREAVEANGVSMKAALGMLRAFVSNVHSYCAYNLPYDERVLRTSGMRVGINDIFPKAHAIDVMAWYAAQTDGGRHRLAQAYQHLIGGQIEDAHDAMADVIATVRVLRQLVLTDN